MRKTLALLSITLCVAACGKKESKPAANNIQAPKPLTQLQPKQPTNTGKELAMMHQSKNMTKIDKPINISADVQKTWKTAKLAIIDKSTGSIAKEFTVKKGETVKYKDLSIKVLYIVPHLMYDNGYVSASNEPINPALIIEVNSNGKRIYAGPLYQKFPNMYNMNHPKYLLRLEGISK